MKKILFILLLSSITPLIFAQEKIYRSSYNINILNEHGTNHFGFGIETSHGIRVWRYFILSANLGYNRYTHLDKNLMYLAGELKWHYFNIKDDKEVKPYLFLSVGPNLKLGNNFIDGGTASIGIGINITGDYNHQFNLAIVKTSEGSYYSNNKYHIDSFGLKLGITF